MQISEIFAGAAGAAFFGRPRLAAAFFMLWAVLPVNPAGAFFPLFDTWIDYGVGYESTPWVAITDDEGIPYLREKIKNFIKEWLKQKLKEKPGWCSLDDWEMMIDELLEDLEK